MPRQPPEEGEVLAAILERLRTQTGRDLGVYRQSTLLRRIGLRCQLLNQSTLAEYLDYLSNNVQEMDALAAELSIRMTSFFRDPDAWAALQTRVIGPLVEAATPEAPLRAWVIGCSTGEEAYTLGILIDEEFENRRAQRHYKVFASDVSESSISCACAGCYPLDISAVVSSTRLKRYFQQRDGRYRVSNEIRSHIIFAAHDVFQDMPIARLNLVSCRNVLIYLNEDEHDGLIDLIRQACLDRGYLFLGTDDAICEGLFEEIDGKHRIFAASHPAGGSKRLRRPLRAQTTAGERSRRAQTLAIAEEELQCVSEELQVVSNELKLKLEEVAQANSHLENLIAATALRESERRIAEELEAMQVLHRMTIAAATASGEREALDQVLCAAIKLQCADMGNIQLLDNGSGTLRIVAHQGFGSQFLARFESVSADDPASCGRALRTHKPVQVSDIPADSEYLTLREAAAEAGYRAVQSTPLISRSGALLGVLSVHFSECRSFSERDTQLAELLARQAADLIEHRSQRQDLAKLENELSTGRAELEEARRQLEKRGDALT